MASGRYRGIPQQDLDIRQIIQEAQIRWLRPPEVCEILRNYQKYNFKLNPVPPNKPTSGALFLFDRKALRYFRKDGHNWRKKKDGKTVREAHERLKAGSIDVLHCYYAHGEENPSFQRRSYWMLEGAYEHIVLVHYLEVSQSHRPGVYHRPLEQPSLLAEGPSYFSPPISEHNGASMSPENFDATGSSVSGELDDADSNDDVEEIQPPLQMPKSEPSLLQQLSLPRDWSSLLSSSPNLVQDPVANVASTSSGSFSQQHHPSLQQNQRLSPAQPAQGRGLMDDDIDLDDLLKNPGKYLGPKPLTPAVSLDVNGWKEILHNYQSSDANGSIEGGMKQEMPSWQEMLEQCTTPATRNSLLGSVAPIKFDDDLFQSPVGNKSNMMPQTTTNPKGIVEALSPRGLGREPQTVLEAHLRAATEENALKSAHSYSLETDTFPLQNVMDIERASQQMETSQSWSFASTQQTQNGALPVSNSNNHWNDVPQQLPQWQQRQDYMASSPAVKDGKLVKQSDAGLKKMDSFGLKKMDSFGLKKMDSFGLKKMDSFGRWVIQQMGEDSPGALAAPSDSGSYWMTPLEDENTPEETSGFSAQMQLDVSISISQVQRYSITDFSPDYAVSNEQVKVLISGRFLETVSKPLDYKWCCMFGDVEVPAELINDGVLRCKVPPHSPGRIPFYITCSDRLACSEVREFEIRSKQEGPLPSKADESNAQCDKDILVQVRLARMLLSADQAAAANKESSSIRICEASIEEWNLIEETIEKRDAGQLVLKEKLLELFFKHKLQKWLSCIEDGSGKGVSVLDEHGQGVLHMVSALGYDWAIKPILEAGVVPDFRDVRGWTALHWAASFGREKTVLALLAAGASPGPVTDPTSRYPNGQMPSDLAAASGHKGIAGYLAEKALTNHLSSLTIAEKNLNEISSTSATLAGETAVQDYIGKRLEGQDEHLSLQRSLSAVRNATKVASLIHSAFRQDSFRKRSMMPEEEPDEYGMMSTEIRSMLATQKIQKGYRGHHDDKVQSAALQIQRKYKGWKGRKDFLNLRKHVVRIQAHVRGHQVRKHFRKILWVVGVIEKAVLRWRRKRVGLRGFRLELAEDKLNGLSSDDEDFLREGRKQKELVLEKAVTRVQSMARSEEARAQYRRMLECSQEAEHEYQQPGKKSYEDEDDIMTSAD